VTGFFNTSQITKDEKYVEYSIISWTFVQENIIDKKNGEWFRGVNSFLKPLIFDKVGPWKASYHNGRMCLEMIRQIDLITK